MLYELVKDEMCFALGPLVDMAGHLQLEFLLTH